MKPRTSIFGRLRRLIPGSGLPPTSEYWELLEDTKPRTVWRDINHGVIVKCEKTKGGWWGIVEPEPDAPADTAAKLSLTPTPVSRRRAEFLAGVYMEDKVALVDCENVESMYPPRASSEFISTRGGSTQ